MKNASKKPGLEFAFYIGLLLLIVLPAMVYAQQDYRAALAAGKPDTIIVNGKKVVRLNEWQQRTVFDAYADTGKNKPVFIGSLRPMNRHSRLSGMADSTKRFNTYYYTDTGDTKREIQTYADNYFRNRNKEPRDHMPIMRPDMERYRMPNMLRNGRPGNRMPENGDRQDFDYNTVDKNGIPTRESFHVSAAPIEMSRKLTGVEINNLNITDLVLVPEFSTGKTMVMFTLPAATTAEVSLTNTDGKILWSEKSSGTKFNKSTMIPLNGIYYLVVKQGAKATVKELVKE